MAASAAVQLQGPSLLLTMSAVCLLSVPAPELQACSEDLGSYLFRVLAQAPLQSSGQPNHLCLL